MGTVHAEPIAAERLVLEPLRVEHADEMAGVLGDPALYAFIGGSPPAPDAVRARYERLVAGSPDPAVSWCNWMIRLREQGCLAGTVQATIRAGAAGREAEIAWVVGSGWQGRGLASEAARALVGWLVRHSIHTIVAHIHPEHHASAAVATAAGLTPTDEWQDGEVTWRSTSSPASP